MFIFSLLKTGNLLGGDTLESMFKILKKLLLFIADKYQVFLELVQEKSFIKRSKCIGNDTQIFTFTDGFTD